MNVRQRALFSLVLSAAALMVASRPASAGGWAVATGAYGNSTDHFQRFQLDEPVRVRLTPAQMIPTTGPVVFAPLDDLPPPGDPKAVHAACACGDRSDPAWEHTETECTYLNRDVSITVRQGERRALVGPNGAGKTTLMNMASGVLRPSEGRVRMLGRDVTSLPVHRRARLGLARTFQITSLLPAMTVAENLAIAVQATSRGRAGSSLTPAPRRTRPPSRWSWRRASGRASARPRRGARA